jgi:hypothetical protein
MFGEIIELQCEDLLPEFVFAGIEIPFFFILGVVHVCIPLR